MPLDDPVTKITLFISILHGLFVNGVMLLDYNSGGWWILQSVRCYQVVALTSRMSAKLSLNKENVGVKH